MILRHVLTTACKWATRHLHTGLCTAAFCATLSCSVASGQQGKSPADAVEPPVPVFKVHTITGCNSDGLDFSPVVVADKLVFVSEREIDLVNYGETGFRKQSYLTIQFSMIVKEKDTIRYTTPKLFSEAISQLQHSGPISFNDSGNFAVFTKVQYFKEGTERIYRPQLFSTRLVKNKWRNIEPLNINQPQYSYGHPALTSDGKKLYFVSDMEGGQGGKDLYYTELTAGSWTQPVNLGPAVNTVGNEAFPFVYKDSLLFFSSDGHPGLGGLDLQFVPILNGELKPIVHLDSSINSSHDDFGIFLNKKELTGYFSSNRNPDRKDDLFALSFKWIKPSEMPKSIAGIFKFRKLENTPAQGLNVYLVNDLGQIVFQTVTDQNGDFHFRNLPYDHNYVIRTDPVNSDLIMLLLDENQQVLAELAVNSKGEFLYKKLSYKEMGGLQFLYTTDNLGLITDETTKTLTGKLDYKTLPYKSGEGMKIMLINEAGDIVYTAFVDKNGNFEFKNLPYDANYIVMTEEYDPDLSLLIFNEGEVVAELSSNPSGKFMFVKLPHSAVTTLALMDVGNNESLYFRGYESDDWFKEANSIAIASKDNRTAYIFKPLGLKDHGSLMTMEGAVSGFCPDTYDVTKEESDECIDITIEELLGMNPGEPKMNPGIQTIYFEKNSSYFTKNDTLLLEKIFEILKSDPGLKCETNGYTDETGEDHYNNWMSERRARRVADYMVFRGLDPARFTTKGWGESNPVSKCNECSEDELRLNRRTEIRIY